MVDHDIGGRLRRAREQRGLSIGDAANLTKLSPVVLRAIERNDFASLPQGLYCKAYLRTLAAEVGLDANQVAADFDALHPKVVWPPDASPLMMTGQDRLIDQLTPSPRGTIVSMTVTVALLMAWFALQRGSSTPSSPVEDAGDESSLAQTAPQLQTAIEMPDARHGDPRVAAVDAGLDGPLRVALTATDWCWVTAETDGERVLYRLVEPGEHLVLEGQRRISMRLGDGDAVTVSINDGPRRTAGADGEVVELDVRSDDVWKVRGGDVETPSDMARRPTRAHYRG